MATIAGFLGLDRSSVSGLIDRAERRGLVARRTSLDDARVTIIDLSAAGAEVGNQVARAVSAEVERLLDGVTASERARFVHFAESLLGRQV
jgi:DNA-binding MarR family transcriptional regulator